MGAVGVGTASAIDMQGDCKWGLKCAKKGRYYGVVTEREFAGPFRGATFSTGVWITLWINGIKFL